MTPRIHVSLPVTDLSAAVAFYQRLFGQPASKQREDYANFRLDDPPIHLALVLSRAAPADRGAQHHGIELGSHEALRQWRDRLADTDPVVEEADARCCYARGDKFWAQDPDGRRWEVWVRTGEHDALAQAPQAVESDPAAACPCA